MNKNIIIMILITLLALSGLYCISQYNINNDIELGKEVTSHWACMDGCFNMLQVLYVTVDNNNTLLEGYHKDCSDKCFNLYMIEGSA